MVATRRWMSFAVIAAIVFVLGAALFVWFVEPFSPRFDASYVGSSECGKCHTGIYAKWKTSPHALMTRRPTEESVVGDFDNGQWSLPEYARQKPGDDQPVARMFKQNDKHYMALRHPTEDRFIPFEIAYVIGFQHRQVYLTQERGGVLRRLPLQWSVPRGEFFSYWNMQENSRPSVNDLWSQMQTTNSAWNLFCARCHTTNLDIRSKNRSHTEAKTEWLEPGIACEACHGPGSLHIEYFRTNYANRIASFLKGNLQGERAAYIASAAKLDKGPAMSVCARCHGSDILLSTTDIFRTYEPGFSRSGRTNDLSQYFKQTPLTPGRTSPTTEVYLDGRPKGIGMLFRSLIESECYDKAQVRCQNCHDQHDNHQPAKTGLLKPSSQSDDYCLGCHAELRSRRHEHVRHADDTPGSHCYDCHMPKTILNITAGTESLTRTHQMSSVPRPQDTLRYGNKGSPNACNQCHDDKTAAWSLKIMQQWYGAK